MAPSNLQTISGRKDTRSEKRVSPLDKHPIANTDGLSPLTPVSMSFSISPLAQPSVEKLSRLFLGFLAKIKRKRSPTFYFSSVPRALPYCTPFGSCLPLCLFDTTGEGGERSNRKP